MNINQWPDIIGKNIAIRLKNVDTPEMKGACYQEILKAREAKKFTVQALRSAKKNRTEKYEPRQILSN